MVRTVSILFAVAAIGATSVAAAPANSGSLVFTREPNDFGLEARDYDHMLQIRETTDVELEARARSKIPVPVRKVTASRPAPQRLANTRPIPVNTRPRPARRPVRRPVAQPQRIHSTKAEKIQAGASVLSAVVNGAQVIQGMRQGQQGQQMPQEQMPQEQMMERGLDEAILDLEIRDFEELEARTRVKTPRRKVTPRPVTRRPTTARRTPTRRPKSTGLERIETGVNVLNTVADSAQTIHGMVQPPVQQRSFDEELVDLEARYFEELDARYMDSETMAQLD